MTIVTDDPAWWPIIDWERVMSYFVVASSTAVVYDWALSFAQEFELVWRQSWSFMTVLYISVRYGGIPFYVGGVLSSIVSVSMTDISCTTLHFAQSWIPVVINAMLGVIMMTRIYAMYQRSKRMLIFLVVLLLASTVAAGVMTAIGNNYVSRAELILSGNSLCFTQYTNPVAMALTRETLIPTLIWEILALCLALWIVAKHFCEVRQMPIAGDSFTMLIKGHVLDFVGFAAVSCFNIGSLSPTLMNSSSAASNIYFGILQIVQPVQMFVLGPRLILGIREYHAKLVASSDEGTGMSTIAFQERGQVSAGDGV
ncbi:hypothetical protein BDR05DRAFT_963914 [Suillus weaverae]|nr:hypothetical protein BDR05DRAFT_963914 [Suillus weaverae]